MLMVIYTQPKLPTIRPITVTHLTYACYEFEKLGINVRGLANKCALDIWDISCINARTYTFYNRPCEPQMFSLIWAICKDD